MSVDEFKKLPIDEQNSFVNPEKTSLVFTQTQVNKGAANAGIPMEQFKQLTSDEQNYFINNFSQFTSILKNIREGK